MPVPIQWFIYSLKKFQDYQGRASRREYWYFVLCNVGLSLIMSFIFPLVIDSSLSAILSALLSLALLIPASTLMIRRLHDTGRSGWWSLFNLLPIIGWLLLFIFFIQPSDPNENQWGHCPESFDKLPPALPSPI